MPTASLRRSRAVAMRAVVVACGTLLLAACGAVTAEAEPEVGSGGACAAPTAALAEGQDARVAPGDVVVVELVHFEADCNDMVPNGTPLPGRPDFPVPIRWIQGDSALHVDDAWTSDAALQVVEVEVPPEASPGQAIIEIQHMRVTVDVEG